MTGWEPRLEWLACGSWLRPLREVGGEGDWLDLTLGLTRGYLVARNWILEVDGVVSVSGCLPRSE